MSITRAADKTAKTESKSEAKDDSQFYVGEFMKDAKMYPEMQAFVALFLADMQANNSESGIHRTVNPFEYWYEKSDINDSWILTALDKIGFRSAISKIKGLTSTMRREALMDPFYSEIESFLSGQDKSDADKNSKDVTFEIVKNLTKFILDTMNYTFVQIKREIKTNPDKIKHYKLMYQLCLDLVSAEKWGKGHRWYDILQTKSGNNFTRFIHTLIKKLKKTLASLEEVAKPDNTRNNVEQLRETVTTTLRTAKLMQLRLISNSSVPINLFSNDFTASAFTNPEMDWYYLQNAPTIPEQIKTFIGTEDRYKFIRDQFFIPEQKQLLAAANTLAEQYTDNELFDKPITGYAGNTNAPLQAIKGSTVLQLLPGEKKEDSSKSTALVPVASTALTIQSQAANNTSSEATFSNQLDTLLHLNATYMQKKHEDFIVNIEPTLPAPIIAALKTTASDSISTAKLQKSKNFIRSLIAVHCIIHELEIIDGMVADAEGAVKEGANLGVLFVATSLKIICDKLKQLGLEVEPSCEGIINSSLDLRSEMDDLNQSKWSYNVNQALGDSQSISDLFDIIGVLVKNIESELTFGKLKQHARNFWVYKQKLAISQKIFFNIDASRTAFDAHFIDMIKLLHRADELQQNFAQISNQDQGFYLDTVSQNQRSLTAPSSTLLIEEISDEEDSSSNNEDQTPVITLDDLKKSTFKDLTWGDILDNSRPFQQGKKLYLEINNVRHLIRRDAQEWIIAKQDASRNYGAAASLVRKLGAAASPDLVKYKAALIQAIKAANTKDEATLKNLHNEKQLNATSIKLLQKSMNRVDNDQKFSFIVFKRDAFNWWFSILAIPVHILLMMGSGIYRLFNYASIKNDDVQFKEYKKQIEALENRQKVIDTEITETRTSLKDRRLSNPDLAGLDKSAAEQPEQSSEQSASASQGRKSAVDKSIASSTAATNSSTFFPPSPKTAPLKEDEINSYASIVYNKLAPAWRDITREQYNAYKKADGVAFKANEAPSNKKKEWKENCINMFNIAYESDPALNNLKINSEDKHAVFQRVFALVIDPKATSTNKLSK